MERARDLVVDLETFQRRLQDFLAREAREWAIESPDLAKEIGELQLSAIVLRSPDRPSHIAMDFRGADEMRFWYCNYLDGEMSVGSRRASPTAVRHSSARSISAIGCPTAE